MIREIEEIRDKVAGFTGVISDLGGPTANMYRLGCRSPEIEAACRKPSCVYPGHLPEPEDRPRPADQDLPARARQLKGIKKILIGSGLRYDLAMQSPEYVKELVQHHVGGYLKIAPEHTEQGPLAKMMKPGIGNYDKFKELFDKYSAEAGKKQYLIPYFIAAHPGTSDEDMMNLALWLKKNGFRADQVQTFYPSPMATATAMYHTGRNPLRKVTRDSEARGHRARRTAAAPAQGLPALSRRQQLAAAARGAEGDGPRRPHRQRQAPADPGLPADHRRRLPERAAQEFDADAHCRQGRVDGHAGQARAGAHPDPAHRPAAAAGCHGQGRPAQGTLKSRRSAAPLPSMRAQHNAGMQTLSVTR